MAEVSGAPDDEKTFDARVNSLWVPVRNPVIGIGMTRSAVALKRRGNMRKHQALPTWRHSGCLETVS